MKKILFYLVGIIPFLVLVSCLEDVDEGLPENIIPSTVRTETLNTIGVMFPELNNAITRHPSLFVPEAEKRIVLSKASEVYITFVSEGASNHNSLGYYTYNSSALPADTTLLELRILFPSVNDEILKQGDMLQVGTSTYPVGTVIGFFIIVKGWEAEKVHFDREKLFTDMAYNPNNDQQHVLFTLKDFKEVILGFEDISASTPGPKTNDYNDLIFTITDNKIGREAISFNLDNVVKL